MENSFPVEYLNSLSLSGLPNHQIMLKKGVVIMLLRNINQNIGLCNGTRMVVTQCLKWSIEAKIITGGNMGTRHFIPRFSMSPTDTRLPFMLRRRQLPISLCFAMTINKSQGQSLSNVGLFIPKPIFSHGQLYVAVSRVTSHNGLKIVIDGSNEQRSNITANIVYKEVFDNLPGH